MIKNKLKHTKFADWRYITSVPLCRHLIFCSAICPTQIATLLNDKIQGDGLSELGKLEQDFVFGDATSKELINILSNRQVSRNAS